MHVAINANKDLIANAIFEKLDAAEHAVQLAPSDPDTAEVCVYVPELHPLLGTAELTAVKDHAAAWLAKTASKPNARKLVVLVSSLLVYGDKPGVEGRQYIDENTPIPPANTAYTKTLRALETAFADLAREKRLPVCVLRTGLAYRDLPSTGDLRDCLFRRIIVDPMKEREFRIPLGGANHISLIHVSDLADAVNQLVSNPKPAAGKSYPLADGHEVTLVQLVEKLARAMKLARPEDNTSFLMTWLGWMSDADRLLTYEQKCDPSEFRRSYPDWSPRHENALAAF